jgi:hypothetical protein
LNSIQVLLFYQWALYTVASQNVFYHIGRITVTEKQGKYQLKNFFFIVFFFLFFVLNKKLQLFFSPGGIKGKAKTVLLQSFKT